MCAGEYLSVSMVVYTVVYCMVSYATVCCTHITNFCITHASYHCTHHTICCSVHNALLRILAYAYNLLMYTPHQTSTVRRMFRSACPLNSATRAYGYIFTSTAIETSSTFGHISRVSTWVRVGLPTRSHRLASSFAACMQKSWHPPSANGSWLQPGSWIQYSFHRIWLHL